MRKRIYLNMCALACIMLVLSSVLMMYLFWDYSKGQIKRQMASEAEDISMALPHIEANVIEQYVKSIASKNKSRITIVAKDGTVLYDTQKDVEHMGNHLGRPEISGAAENGVFFDVRYSKTSKSQTYYYAVRLSSGEILRLAYIIRNKFWAFKNVVPVLLFAFVLMMIFSLTMAWKMSNAIIKPINNIDIHNPETNFEYKEFNPLLRRISKYNDERKKNEKLRREFSANVSHELKTPITSISGYADLLRNGMVKSEDVELFAEKIYKESQRLINLVNDIIKLSRLDEKRVGIERELIRLDTVADHVRESLIPVTDKYRVSFEMDVEQVKFLAVEIMMEELLYNLCENAIKYNHPGGYVKLSIHQQGDKVVIRVSDNGIGIPKDCQNRIFERFYRVDKSHSKQIGGTGLGLAIVKHVVEYHEGIIDIDSDVNQGTTITVTMQGAK